jgi:hypothetical protein
LLISPVNYRKKSIIFKVKRGKLKDKEGSEEKLLRYNTHKLNKLRGILNPY